MAPSTPTYHVCEVTGCFNEISRYSRLFCPERDGTEKKKWVHYLTNK